MRETIVTFGTVAGMLRDKLAKTYDLLECGKTPPLEKFSADQLTNVRAAVTMGGGGISHIVMETLPKLGLMATTGSGYEYLDLSIAKRRGIVVANTVGGNAYSVADMAMALLLAIARNIPRYDADVRAGKWTMSPYRELPMGLGLAGSKIGVYGMGAIGRKIAQRAAGFDAEVQYCNRTKFDDLPYRHHAQLETLADWCDVLMIAVRVGDFNRKIVNADILKRLGAGGYVVNISRGIVIDEDALIAALKAGTIAGAGLDVFEQEPRPNPGFFDLPNVVLSPHTGSYTNEAFSRMHQNVLDNLSAFYAGKRPPFAVPLD